MPKELPKVDLEHPSDLDYITHAVQKYAMDIAQERLRARSRGGSSALGDTMEQAVERVRAHGLPSGCMQRVHASFIMCW